MHLVPEAWWRFKLTRALIILEVKSMYFLLYLLHYWGYCVTLTPGCHLGFLKHHRKTGIYHHGSTHSWFLFVAHDITFINGKWIQIQFCCGYLSGASTKDLRSESALRHLHVLFFLVHFFNLPLPFISIHAY